MKKFLKGFSIGKVWAKYIAPALKAAVIAVLKTILETLIPTPTIA